MMKMRAFAVCCGLLALGLPGFGAEPVVRTVRMLEGEHWWGLASGKGTELGRGNELDGFGQGHWDLFRQADGVEPVCLRKTSLKYWAEENPQSAAIRAIETDDVSSFFRATLIRWRASQSAGVSPV